MHYYVYEPDPNAAITEAFAALAAGASALFGTRLDDNDMAKIPPKLRKHFKLAGAEITADGPPLAGQDNHNLAVQLDLADKQVARYRGILSEIVCMLDGDDSVPAAVTESDIDYAVKRLKAMRMFSALPRGFPLEAYTLVNEIGKECLRAREKFPNPVLVLTALTEEHGELVQAVMNHYHAAKSAASETKEGSPVKPLDGAILQAQIHKELVQTGAMLLRLALEGDPAHLLPPTTVRE